MTKKNFEFVTWTVLAVTLGPLAWYVHSTYPLNVQFAFYVVVIVISFALRKWFYLPIWNRLPGENDKR